MRRIALSAKSTAQANHAEKEQAHRDAHKSGNILIYFYVFEETKRLLPTQGLRT